MTAKKNSDWVVRLVHSRILSDAQVWAIEGPVRCAVQRLIDGEAMPGRDKGRPGATSQDMGLVGYAVNLAWFRCRKLLDDVGMRCLEEAGKTLSGCERRGDAVGFYLLLPEEKEAVCAGVNLYAAVLRESSLMQWADAEADFIQHCAEARTAA